MSGKNANQLHRVRVFALRLCDIVFPATSACGNVPVTSNSALDFIYCVPINVPSGIKPPINSVCFIEWRFDVAFEGHRCPRSYTQNPATRRYH